MLRATNTGSTAVIDHKGRVLTQLQPYTVGTLAASVQGYRGITPYILVGNTAIVLLAGLLLVMAWLLTRKNRRKSHDPKKNR